MTTFLSTGEMIENLKKLDDPAVNIVLNILDQILIDLDANRELKNEATNTDDYRFYKDAVIYRRNQLTALVPLVRKLWVELTPEGQVWKSEMPELYRKVNND